MLMMPEVNSSSTVSTSPTKRETAAPDSWFTKASAGSLSSLAHMALRRAWVILCPNTISKLSRRESNPPESASSPKYPNASAKGTTCRAVRRSTTRPSTSGGSRLGRHRTGHGQHQRGAKQRLAAHGTQHNAAHGLIFPVHPARLLPGHLPARHTAGSAPSVPCGPHRLLCRPVSTTRRPSGGTGTAGG